MNAQVQWPTVLQVQGKLVDAETIERQYRLLARKRHPDAGGSNEAMTELNLAKDAALKWIAEQALIARQAEAARIAAAQAEVFFKQAFNQQMHAQQSVSSQWANSFGGLGNMAGAAANASASRNEEWLQRSAKEEKRKTKWERVKAIMRGER